MMPVRSQSYNGSEADKFSDFSNSDVSEKASIAGVISKWTNYISGWQDRYVCCQDGTLCYYRTEDEAGYGCRGSISLSKADVVSHEFDPCRFDICVNDSIWYLRVSDEVDRQQWIQAIEANKITQQPTSKPPTPEPETVVNPFPSFHSGGDFKDKLAELQTFRKILDTQIDTLQGYFDACAKGGEHFDSNVPGNEDKVPSGNGVKPTTTDGVDFKGEAITFKATTAGIQSLISHCFEIIAEQGDRMPVAQTCHGDSESVGNVSEDMDSDSETSDDESAYLPAVQAQPDHSAKKKRHRFSDDLEKRIQSHLMDSLNAEDASKWDLIVEDGELKVYKKVVGEASACDPLKAVHSIGHVTAREMCHYFWKSEGRKEWEESVEHFVVVENLDELTVVLYQTHKQIWPVAQRDCLYLTSILKIDNPPPTSDDREPHDTWMVCNFSVDHDEADPVPGCTRATVEIALICQTYVTPPSNGGPIDRDCLKCDIIYVANVNPGGWAPVSIIQTVCKREIPKFLRNFTSYVQSKTENEEISF